MIKRNFFERAVRTFGKNSELILIAYSFYKQHIGKERFNEPNYMMQDENEMEDCIREVHRNMDSQMFCQHFRPIPIFTEPSHRQEIKDRTFYKILEHFYQYEENHNEKLKKWKNKPTEIRSLEGEEFEFAISFIGWEYCNNIHEEYSFLEALVYNKNICEVLGENEAHNFLDRLRMEQREGN